MTLVLTRRANAMSAQSRKRPPTLGGCLTRMTLAARPARRVPRTVAPGRPECPRTMTRSSSTPAALRETAGPCPSVPAAPTRAARRPFRFEARGTVPARVSVVRKVRSLRTHRATDGRRVRSRARRKAGVLSARRTGRDPRLLRRVTTAHASCPPRDGPRGPSGAAPRTRPTRPPAPRVGTALTPGVTVSTPTTATAGIRPAARAPVTGSTVTAESSPRGARVVGGRRFSPVSWPCSSSGSALSSGPATRPGAR